MDFWTLVLATVVTAATPLILASLGEYVTEKSGVLNLGVEGMMIVGAASAFAIAVTTDNALIGIIAGVLAAMALSGLFAFFTVWLAANQVASGLALTIAGIGVAGLIGAPFVGANRAPVASVYIPGLSDLPVIGKIFFAQSPFAYGALALAAGIWWFLKNTRAGLVLRGVGESHGSAHALGHDVRKVRTLAVLFGGACAGLAGAYLSLVYTTFWSPGMTSGRGWIALALVVFAGGRIWRLLLGSYLFGAATVAQLHAQAGNIGLPAQALSALPFAVTILALVMLSVRAKNADSAAGSLGRPFIPDR